MDKIAMCARILESASRDLRTVDPIESHYPLTLDEAYAIQRATIALRVERGERRVGVKMGLTSQEKMRQMGVEEAIWGRLTDAMQLEAGGTLSLRHYIQARVEPEIAFLLKRPLVGRLDRRNAVAAIDAVAPALEIVDSRYHDFKFNVREVVADNCAGAGFIVGPWSAGDRDIDDLKLTLRINGRVARSGSSAAIMNSPIESLIVAARLSEAAGEPLRAGWIVMAGAVTAAEPLQPGDDVQLECEHLGRVGIHVVA